MQLELHNWRCFPQLHVDLPDHSFAIVDQNGTGKTTLLSALYTLHTGLCWPETNFHEHMRHGSQYIGIRHSNDWFWSAKRNPSGRLSYKYQGNGENPHILIYTPDDNRWLTLSRTSKLQVLDTLIMAFDPSYTLHLRALNQVVRQKQRLLKKISLRKDPSDDTLAHVMTKHILKHSSMVWQIRSDFWFTIAEALPEFSQWIHSVFDDYRIQRYHTFWDGKRYPHHELPVISWSDKHFYNLWRREQIAEKVLFGAQRDDFQLFVESDGSKNAAKVFSRGELRLLTMFIKYAYSQYKSKIVWWFLDDAFNEFDSTREEFLARNMLNNCQKVIATGTHPIPDIHNFNIQALKV